MFLNPERVDFFRVKFDGCLVKNAVACDWLVIRQATDNILVELKGTDVEHALEQIEAAFEYMAREKLLADKNAALIVCSRPHRTPKFSSKLQKARARLSERYKAPLHVVTARHEFIVDRVMSQTGPF